MNEREPDLAVLIAEREKLAPRHPRHPTQLTEDRLVEHLEKYAEHLTAAEVAAINVTAMALGQIPDRELAARQAGVGHG